MPLSNIQSCQEDQYGHFDTLNVQICPLLIQWATAVGLEKNNRQRTENRRITEKPTTKPPLIVNGTAG